ncbi:MAG TPA: hypothetical protein VGN52_13380 [Burkholderiales bacterium]
MLSFLGEFLFFVALAAPLMLGAWSSLRRAALARRYPDNAAGAGLRGESFFYRTCQLGAWRAQLALEIRRDGLRLKLGLSQQSVHAARTGAVEQPDARLRQ